MVLCRFTVEYNKQLYKLKLYVVDGGSVTLLGREWLQEIKLDWKNSVKSIKSTALSLDELKTRYADLYSDKLGTLRNFKARLHIKENTVPVFLRARSVPYAMRTRIETELSRLEQEGVISKTNSSEWATPNCANCEEK